MRFILFQAFILFMSISIEQGFTLAKPQNEDIQKSAELEKAPDEILQLAENAFQYGDYQLAIKLYQSVLHPNKIQKTRNRLIALTQLGICYYSTDKKDLARKEFEDVLKISPRHTLDPFLYPPQIIQFFNEVKRDLASLLAEIAKVQDEEQRALKELKKAELKAIEARAKQEQLMNPTFQTQKIETMQKNSFLLAILPFGIAQFQNEDDNLGYFFLAGQSLALSANIGSYAYVLSLADEQGWYSSENKLLAKDMQKLQVGSFYAFLGLWSVSAIHGIMHFQETKPLKYIQQKHLKKTTHFPLFITFTTHSAILSVQW